MAGLAVVLPTCRPESLATFVAAWEDQFARHNVELIVVEDKQSTWDKLPAFVPNRTGSIRSYGFLQAYERGYDVVTLDDDCLPAPDVDLIAEYQTGFDTKFAVSSYYDIGHEFGLDEYMRGFPFYDRDKARPVLQYGGWDNVPDLDAITQAEHERHGPVGGYRFDRRVVAIPRGAAFTGCIMNVAIAHEAIPMMYQLIMGNDRVGYDRWDDIWSGLFAKRICDHLGLPIIVNGRASIVHTRASDTASNRAKEQNGYVLNERMWRNLDAIVFEGTTIIECYQELADQLRPAWFGAEGHKIRDGVQQWLQALSG